TSEPFANCFESLQENKQLNIGCVLNDKSFVFDNTEQISFSKNNETLIFFFLKLLLELQKLGTVRPMDLNKYIDQLDSQ
ncbi:MAG: hypothetical protein Q8K02_07405, partial [Flavobacterium sp.]|nr:hypothetical protein [Flavobacterium sp.]